MENINIFDLIVISLVTLLGLKGLVRGFLKEFFGLVGIVGGVFVASRVAGDMGAFANTIIPMENNNTILMVGFVVSIVLFWIVAYLLGTILSKMFSMSGLGIFDRLFGFAFGAGKIFLLFAIISYAVSNVKMINDNLKPKLKDSVVFPLLVESGKYILQFDSQKIQGTVSKKIEDAVESTKDTIKEISQKEITKEIEKKITETKNNLEEKSE